MGRVARRRHAGGACPRPSCHQPVPRARHAAGDGGLAEGRLLRGERSPHCPKPSRRALTPSARAGVGGRPAQWSRGVRRRPRGPGGASPGRRLRRSHSARPARRVDARLARRTLRPALRRQAGLVDARARSLPDRDGGTGQDGRGARPSVRALRCRERWHVHLCGARLRAAAARFQ
eukprot:scaffold1386_cov119-Isochrysis_galbana.AAC.6